MPLEIGAKQEGQLLAAGEFNQTVAYINTVEVEANTISHAFADTDFVVDGTADDGNGNAIPVIKVNPTLLSNLPSSETRATLLTKLQIIPAENLPPVYFDNVNGTGTVDDPYVIPTVTGVADYLTALPGYEAGTDKMLIGGNGFSWADIPTGTTNGTLATPTVTIGTPSSTTIPVNWNTVTNATSYSVQRDTTSGFTAPVTIYTGSALTFTDSGLTVSTHYYYRVRATASGWTSSLFGLADNTTAANDEVGLTPVTGLSSAGGNWVETSGFVVSTNNLTPPSGNTDTNIARSNMYIPAGAVGSIQATGFARLALDDNPSVLALGSAFNFALNVNSVNNKLSTSAGTSYLDSGAVSNTVNPRIRLRADVNNIYFGLSVDGSTWTEVRTVARVAGVDLYVKADSGASGTDSLLNILGSGLVLNSSLT